MLRHRETNSRGCFVAWGTGLYYEYDPRTRELLLECHKKNIFLLQVELDPDLARSPISFISCLEKTTQIESLMYSNNATLDMAEIFDGPKLPVILNNSLKVARHGFDLRHRKFSQFAAAFCEEFSLSHITIKRTVNYNSSAPCYNASLQTRSGNGIHSSAPALAAVICDLSRKVMQELLIEEYAQPSQSNAHNLLTVSSKLSLIGRILDERFSPLSVLKAKKKIRTGWQAQTALTGAPEALT